MPNNRIIIDERSQIVFNLKAASPSRNKVLRTMVSAGDIRVHFLEDRIPLIVLNEFQQRDKSLFIDSDSFFIDGLPAFEQTYYLAHVRHHGDSDIAHVSLTLYQPLEDNERTVLTVRNQSLDVSPEHCIRQIHVALENALLKARNHAQTLLANQLVDCVE